jgi:hypothetical protein
MRVSHAHFPRRGLRSLNIDELALADPGAPPAGLVPRLSAFNQFRPIGKASALNGLGQMNAAAAALQKRALRMSRDTQAPQVLRAINVAPLEFLPGRLQICREAPDVVFGQVNEALPFTALRAAGLAFESHEIGGHGKRECAQVR